MTDEELTPEERKEAEDAINSLLNAPARTDLEMFESAKIRAIQEVQNNPKLSDEEKITKITQINNQELDV
jgi:hypothetical protein